MDISKLNEEEITKAINESDFLLYGDYKKTEKKKLLKLFDGDYELLGIHTSPYGNRVLSIRIYTDGGDFWKYNYEY